jgi:hypothetical protein
MTITNTLKTAEQYRQAGFTNDQASTMAKLDEEHAGEMLEAIRAVFAPEFARIDDRFARINAQFDHLEKRMDDRFGGVNDKFAGVNDKFGLLEAKIEAKIESVARDQLFKIVALFLSAAAATIGAVVLAISLSR